MREIVIDQEFKESEGAGKGESGGLEVAAGPEAGLGSGEKRGLGDEVSKVTAGFQGELKECLDKDDVQELRVVLRDFLDRLEVMYGELQ